MPTYVAFLRAVNVGKRRYPMAELREALTAAGFTDVETHIQTGNVRVGTPLRSRVKVVAALEQAMLADRGFEVPVVLLTPAELAQVYAEARLLAQGRELSAHYVTLLRAAPSVEGSAAVEARTRDGEEVRVGERAVHLMLRGTPYHEASTGNAEVERHLGLATTRNLTVLSTLTQKWAP